MLMGMGIAWMKFDKVRFGQVLPFLKVPKCPEGLVSPAHRRLKGFVEFKPVLYACNRLHVHKVILYACRHRTSRSVLILSRTNAFIMTQACMLMVKNVRPDSPEMALGPAIRGLGSAKIFDIWNSVQPAIPALGRPRGSKADALLTIEVIINP